MISIASLALTSSMERQSVKTKSIMPKESARPKQLPQGGANAKLQYAATDRVVWLGTTLICNAKSATYAQRIAAALNVYKPDRRGK